MDGLLHVLAELMHLCRLGVLGDSQSGIHRSMSHTQMPKNSVVGS